MVKLVSRLKSKFIFISLISLMCCKSISVVNPCDRINTLKELDGWKSFYFHDEVNPKYIEDYSLDRFKYASYDEFHLKFLSDKSKKYTEPFFYTNHENLIDINKQINCIDIDKRREYSGDDFLYQLQKDLLFHPRYRHSLYHVQIPNSYANYLIDVFNDIKLTLSENSIIYNKIKDVNLVFYNGEIPLDLRYYDNTQIIISPALARAIFFFTTNDYIENISEEIEKNDERTVKIYLSLLYANTFSTLSFLIHHELAHIYLKDSEIESIAESRCDCYALYYMNKVSKRELCVKFSPSGNLGIWFSLIENLIEQNDRQYWNIHTNDDIEDMKKRIDLIRERNITNLKECNTKYE